MLCQKCNKNVATMHIKTVVNGKTDEKHLCSKCYADNDFNFTDFSIPNIFSSLIENEFPPKNKTIQKCSVCGTTLNEILTNGKPGCPKCYETFKNNLIPYIRRIQKSDNHIGKIPEGFSKSNNNEEEELKNKLKLLIAEENFEEAAIIRDKLKALQGDAK
ncbi:MAG: UvrB/UvrC motif-containing protein [Clostridia bacterium]|nr:UvrB/UvrC motif-containing protein [Clostridia bacterium]